MCLFACWWRIIGGKNTMSLEDRFWNKVDKETESGCWEWVGSTRNGYGCIRPIGVTKYSHRVSWELHNGPIPDGLWVLHKCDNRKCVNPDHLFLGTNQDNVNDKMSKGRGPVGARNGMYGKTGKDSPSYGKGIYGERNGMYGKGVFGARNGSTKLSDSQIVGILNESDKTHTELGKKYGVSRARIGQIIKNGGR